MRGSRQRGREGRERERTSKEEVDLLERFMNKTKSSEFMSSPKILIKTKR
jgi:hypothetical protein